MSLVQLETVLYTKGHVKVRHIKSIQEEILQYIDVDKVKSHTLNNCLCHVLQNARASLSSVWIQNVSI